MEQLPLDVGLADFAVFDSFLAAGNEEALHALRALALTGMPSFVWIWGPSGVGRTHLLQACVNAAAEAGARAAYLPLGTQGEAVQPAIAEGLGEFDVVCLDDVGAAAGDREWERALLMLYERLRARGGRLAMAAEQAPANGAFALPDLASRFSSAATFRLALLSDDNKLRALQLRADWRGLTLPSETGRYLLARVDRSVVTLFDLLDQLDRHALARQRRLTVPFVREFLAQTSARQ